MKPLIQYGRAIYEGHLRDAEDAGVKPFSKARLIEHLVDKPFLTPQGEFPEGAQAADLNVIPTEEPRKGKGIYSVVKPHLLSGAVGKVAFNRKQLLKKLRELASDGAGTSSAEIPTILLPSATLVFKGSTLAQSPDTLSEELLEALVALNTDEKPAMSDGGTRYSLFPDLPPALLEKFIQIQKRVRLKTQQAFQKARYETKEKKIVFKNYGNFCANFEQYGGPQFKIQNLLSHYKEVGRRAKQVLDEGKGDPGDGYLAGAIDPLLKELAQEPRHFYAVSSQRGVEALYCDPLLFEIALEGNLKDILQGLRWAEAPLESEQTKKAFEIKSERFLRLLTRNALQEFLAIRTLYPANLTPLFRHYMQQKEKIRPEIVESARAYGQWIGTQAWHAAAEELDLKPDNADDYRKVEALKAKHINELESGASHASSVEALLSQLTTRASRLTNATAPEAATAFLVAACTGEISHEQAKHLCLLFMRTRSERPPENKNLKSQPQKDPLTTNS